MHSERGCYREDSTEVRRESGGGRVDNCAQGLQSCGHRRGGNKRGEVGGGTGMVTERA